MRVSTSMIFELGAAGMQNQQQALLRLQQQIASGRRMLAPADDPTAAAAVLDVKQAQAINAQFPINGDAAIAQLGMEENALADATTLLQNVKTLAVYAGNPTLSDQDRASLATELESNYQELLAVANRDDGNGQYLFSGYKGATRPFTEMTPGNVSYNGDAGQRLVRIGAAREVAVNDSGEAVFRAIRDGNGSFAAAAGGSNAGSGVIDAGTVTDPARWNDAANAGSFSIRFHVDSGVTPPQTTYDVVDTVNNLSLLTGAAPAAGPHPRTYTPGAAITLARRSPPDTNPTPFDFGAEVAIDGAPADGDTFSIRPSADRDIFTTLHGLITALRGGSGSTPATRAAYQNNLNVAMPNLDHALDSVLTARTSVGARLKEIDNSKATSEALALNHSATLSRLEDLDYARAISDLSLQQTYLQAAQQSFLRVTSLDLFSLL